MRPSSLNEPIDTALGLAMSAEISALRSMGRVLPELASPNSCIEPRHDFFSNDYLSLSTSPELCSAFTSKISSCPPHQLLGATGSRLAGGSTPLIQRLEDKLKTYYEADAALLFNSGFDANACFFSRVPQDGDVVVYDACVHASAREGIRMSRPAISSSRALYAFKHNDMGDFRRVILQVLDQHPRIAEGRSTLFVAVESLYSMDGGFVPLPQLLLTFEELVPRSARHLVVDEAHTTGICGRGGRGFVDYLGLQDRIQTRLHTFGKAPAVAGAVLICSPLVRKYIINGSRHFIFTTALPGYSVLAIEASLEIIDSPTGRHLTQKLMVATRLFYYHLTRTLARIPPHILRLQRPCAPSQHPNHSDSLVSPIFPLLTSYCVRLEDSLQLRGYKCQAIQWPVVPKGEDRVRVSIHASNTEEEMLAFLELLTSWAAEVIRDEGTAHSKIAETANRESTNLARL